MRACAARGCALGGGVSQLGQSLFRKTPTVEPRSVAGSSTSAASYAIIGRCGTSGCFCHTKLPMVEKAG